MLLSEMFGVEQDVDFEVIGYTGIFMIRARCDGIERLWWRLKDNYIYANADLDVLYDIILKAPSGIIHLPPPLTDEQREQLRAIWTLGGRWLAKDMTGDTFAFGYKPVKSNDWLSWIMSNDDKRENLFSVYRDLEVCGLVSWSDPEPYDIGKALGVEG